MSHLPEPKTDTIPGGPYHETLATTGIPNAGAHLSN
jgi:hypothetical protein